MNAYTPAPLKHGANKIWYRVTERDNTDNPTGVGISAPNDAVACQARTEIGNWRLPSQGDDGQPENSSARLVTDGGIPDVDEWVGADCPECGVEIGAGSIRNTGYALEHKNPEAHPQAGHHVITETVVDDDGVATDGGRDLGEFCDRVEFADHDREPLVQAASALRSAADEFEAHASRREDPLEAIDERIAKLERVLAQGPYGTVGRTRTDGGSPGDGTDWSTYPNPLDTIPDWTETDSVPLTEQADIDLDPALVSELRRIDRQSAADGRVVEVSDGLLQIKLSYDLSTGGDE